jgi:glutamate-5-semialdehyde dehydrogenase
MSAVLKSETDIPALMRGMGQRARAAARAMARAPTAAKNTALKEIAAAIRARCGSDG